MRQLMQQQLAFFAAWMRRQHLAAQLAELGEPRTQIFRQLLIDLTPKPLRKGRALPGGRDGDLQVASANHGAEEEIAVGNIVNRIAGYAALQRSLIGRMFSCLTLKFMFPPKLKKADARHLAP